MKIGHERGFFATATDCAAGAAASIFSSLRNLLAGKERGGGKRRKVFSSSFPDPPPMDDKDVRRHILILGHIWIHQNIGHCLHQCLHFAQAR